VDELTIFGLYRRALAIVLATYVVVRTVSFVWQCRGWYARSNETEALLWRYVLALLVRMRARRFWLELTQIVGLTILLLYLLRLHW